MLIAFAKHSASMERKDGGGMGLGTSENQGILDNFH
jgi:hypothetical protein